MPFKKWVKVKGYKFRNNANRWQTSKFIKVASYIFALAVTVSEINVLNFYIQKVGQSHGVQFLQWRYLMANIKIYQIPPYFIALALTVSDILTFQVCLPSKVGYSHGVQLSLCWQIIYANIENVKICKGHCICAISNLFRYINFYNF